MFTDGTALNQHAERRDMKLDGSIALFDYWNRLRAGRTAPRRTEVEPADIKTLLADTFILERDTRGEAVFRLAGTRLCAIFGRELKGFSFSSLWLAKDRRLVARLAHSVFHSKAIVVMTFAAVTQNNRTAEFELLLLPLDGGSDHQRSLGIVTPSSKPFWLGADPVVEARVDTVRVVDPELEPMFLKNRPAVPVPLARGVEVGRDLPPPAGRRIRHLVVLEGGREH